MKLSANLVFIILTVVILAGGVYWYVYHGSSTEAPLTAEVTQSVAQAQFQTLVTELEPISFDPKIFSDPRFAALVDLTTPIAPEPPGRTDPFAPIAGAGSP